MKTLEEHLHLQGRDSFFAQRTGDFAGGWSRRLYDELSKFSHTRPGLANADLWSSNGPIYASAAFLTTVEIYAEVYAL